MKKIKTGLNFVVCYVTGNLPNRKILIVTMFLCLYFQKKVDTEKFIFIALRNSLDGRHPNFHMAWVSWGNFRKWADAWEPYPFIGDRDIDTKSRPKSIFRNVIRAMAAVIDDNRQSCKNGRICSGIR